MTTRRDFMKGMAAAAAIMAVSSSRESHAANYPATGIVYTAANPGQWDKKAASHAPKITRTGDDVAIETPHPMSVEHFIVRHTLVLADGKVVGAHTFQPSAPSATSTLRLPEGYKGKFYATSFCNKHDLWVSEGE